MAFINLREQESFSPAKLTKNNFFDCPQMVADVYCLEPGQHQQVHAHAGEAKIYVVLTGRGDFTVGTEVRTLHAGQSACCPAGVVHGVANPYAERLTALVVMAPNPNLRK